MVKRLTIKQNDLQPYYFCRISDKDGAVDLTGATIYCTMEASDGILKIDRQRAGITLLDQSKNKGEFYYAWQPGDTDTQGLYLIEFEINPVQGGKFTVPIDNSAEVFIPRSLDTQ